MGELAWRRLVTWLAVAFALLAGPAAGSTLCYGLDGHVEVERAAGGHCVEGALALHTATAATLDRTGDCCGPCTDVEAISALDLVRRVDDGSAPPPASLSHGRASWPSPGPRHSLRTFVPTRAPALRSRALRPLALRC